MQPLRHFGCYPCLYNGSFWGTAATATDAGALIRYIVINTSEVVQEGDMLFESSSASHVCFVFFENHNDFVSSADQESGIDSTSNAHMILLIVTSAQNDVRAGAAPPSPNTGAFFLAFTLARPALFVADRFSSSRAEGKMTAVGDLIITGALATWSLPHTTTRFPAKIPSTNWRARTPLRLFLSPFPLPSHIPLSLALCSTVLNNTPIFFKVELLL